MAPPDIYAMLLPSLAKNKRLVIGDEEIEEMDGVVETDGERMED